MIFKGFGGGSIEEGQLSFILILYKFALLEKEFDEICGDSLKVNIEQP